MSEVPIELWAQVDQAMAGTLDPNEAGRALVEWVDGRSPDDLAELLGVLRDQAAYPVSLVVLENAWQAEMPTAELGKIAQDWIGTLLHGFGDRAAAVEVIERITPRVLELGTDLAGDLGDLLLSWGLHAQADPLIRAAAAAHPGDMSLQFNLGVVLKFAREWVECQRCFQAVLRHHDERAARWNLGIASTALGDWPTARRAWSGVGFKLPEGDGDFATPGELTAVRLPTAEGAPAPFEVLWGDRLCPARVRLTTIPRWPGMATLGDVLLIDGVSVDEVTIGETSHSVLPALARLSTWGGQAFEVRGAYASKDKFMTAAQILTEAGWPAADWSHLGEASQACLGMVVPPDRSKDDAMAALKKALPVPHDIIEQAAL